MRSPKGRRRPPWAAARRRRGLVAARLAGHRDAGAHCAWPRSGRPVWLTPASGWHGGVADRGALQRRLARAAGGLVGPISTMHGCSAGAGWPSRRLVWRREPRRIAGRWPCDHGPCDGAARAAGRGSNPAL
jgi:hypothetical protein